MAFGDANSIYENGVNVPVNLLPAKVFDKTVFLPEGDSEHPLYVCKYRQDQRDKSINSLNPLIENLAAA